MYVSINDLPGCLQRTLTAVGYNRKDIRVETSKTISPIAMGGHGRRSFFGIINLETENSKITYGSWGGANMFAKHNIVDNDSQEHPLISNCVAISGSEGGGHPVNATLTVLPSMIAKFLPAPAAVTDREADILYYFRSYTSAGRKQEFERMGVEKSEFDALVDKGLVKRNKAGAMQITTEGKNCVKRRY